MPIFAPAFAKASAGEALSVLLNCRFQTANLFAEVAHLVEHDLAKVGVAGSSPVFRSRSSCPFQAEDFFFEGTSSKSSRSSQVHGNSLNYWNWKLLEQF
jgi:hypothetical protein